MAEYKWPDADKRLWIGKRVSRIDGPDKVSGRAKYSYDVNRPGMLWAKVVRCPFAHAKIVSIDTSAAEKMAGVKAIELIHKPGDEIQWAEEDIVAIAAVDEPTAEDAVRAVKIEYQRLPHLVVDSDPKVAGDRAKTNDEEKAGDPDKAFAEAEVVIEGEYGLPVIAHCCLEAHPNGRTTTICWCTCPARPFHLSPARWRRRWASPLPTFAKRWITSGAALGANSPRTGGASPPPSCQRKRTGNR